MVAFVCKASSLTLDIWQVKYVYCIQANKLRRQAGYCIQAGRAGVVSCIQPQAASWEAAWMPRDFNQNFLDVSMFGSCFRKITTTDFWPATSCAIRLTIRSIASQRKPFLRRRGNSAIRSRKLKKFLKNFFQIFDKLQNF